ncbi:MAG TPA: hypothetical protein VFY85_07880 [Gemmatimonadaceae bacterium]|nr:hypothetical protein [Gemmatimonadaceae bacterium]
MNWGVVGALVLLLIWAIAALVMEGPGWVHLLLTVGVSLLIYSIVTRASRREPGGRTTPRNDRPR